MSSIKSAAAALSEAFDSLVEEKFGYADDSRNHFNALIGANEAVRVYQKNRANRRRLPHIAGLDAAKYPELSKDTKFSTAYLNGYNLAVDFVADFLGWK